MCLDAGRGRQRGCLRAPCRFPPKSSHDPPALPPLSAAPTRFITPAVSQTAGQREELATPGKMLWLLSSPAPCPSFMQRWQGPGKRSRVMCHHPRSAAKRSSFPPPSRAVCAGSSTGAECLQTTTSGKFREVLEPLLSWCFCAAWALQGSCVSTDAWLILPVTSGREFRSYQYWSVLRHVEQVKALSAHSEICC